ncbi:MAG TPA: hypothetical protein PLQ89_05565 [Phycisphaerae bacterium]|nr:hypothetical protein [Phycisphaerae bacterium]HOQ85169.1 hypothetical protein [Phycisphaerae bacterium]
MMCMTRLSIRRVLLFTCVCACTAFAGPERYRKPAPAEDHGELIEEPVFGPCAGHDGTDQTLQVFEWVAKRTWHILGLAYERKDFTGPPAMTVDYADGWAVIRGTVADAGVPLRNQVITAEIRQVDQPVLITLRGTDAFGEVLVELDLKRGHVRARSVEVSRSMIGGQSHSSPMPEQSSNRIITERSFEAIPSGEAKLKIRTQGEHITLWANDREVVSFVDPDPAAGKFGLGSVGTLRARNLNQWELISPYEKQRREACWKEMRAFCKQIDSGYDDDVRARNRVERSGETLLWTWPATGATARFQVDGPRVRAKVGAGLYGNDTLIDGVFPEVTVVAADGEEFTADPGRQALIEGDALALRFTLPLRSPSGKTAIARVLAKLTVQTVWFWTIEVDGVQPKSIQAYVGLADGFRLRETDLKRTPDAMFGDKPRIGKAIMRQNGKAGIYVKLIEPANTHLGVRPNSDGQLDITTSDPKLRFATSILPAQPLNLIGFKNRMVHYIRYPEGPIQHWRRAPSYQEYPTNADLARFAGHGTDAMVWHHTWLSNDYRDREGFFVNHAEMKRAMDETHRLGMTAIGYLGIVPGRSSLLGFEDTIAFNDRSSYGGYTKNWDLQDHTFYHVGGRYPDFITWMADYWCKEYGLDGFYLDGGAFGQPAFGPSGKPMHPEDAGLSIDELQHRTYWRVKKVLAMNGAGYGLEPWSGLNWLINGFYDCMMIGESFQEAPPEFYRDGHNALLTGCMIKMYGMRASSQNPYNIAMAAINLSDIQVCSGNGAWGDDPDDAETWKRVRPLWDLLDSIDWDRLVDARPWYAQELVSGEGFYAGNYTEPERAIVFLANRSEQPATFDVRIDPAKLPKIDGVWTMRYCLGRKGQLGELGDGNLRVHLPALHDGPIGIELKATPRDVAAKAKFVPSTEGKKLLCFNGRLEGDDEIAFDGVITGGPLCFRDKIDAAKLDAWATETAAKNLGRHTDNFFLCYSVPGKDASAFDWFDEHPWIVENWRLMAAAAKKAGFKGICFDTEYYEGLPLFGYSSARHSKTRTFEEYRRQVYTRAAEIMRAVNQEFPDITILILFGYSGSFHGVPQHAASRAEHYTLVAAFVDGLLSECGPQARVFDMHEQCFSFRVPGSYARARAMMTDLLAETSYDPERYRRHHRVGFSFWADCWENASEDRPFDVDVLDNNYYTPEEFAYSLHQALAYSDGYVWMWPGVIRWWDRTARTVDENGKEVVRPLPQAYIDALKQAHAPSLPEPPRDRKPNTYRVLPANTQEGYSDEATFGDLWQTHEFIADLPLEWRFQIDPDEKGLEQGWHRPQFDDSAWPTIRIREFWEPQGYSPYDGAAWYRLSYTPPELPKGRRVYLAFGGVAEEATVFVNGRELYASPYGENIRHKRFCVDVTDELKPGQPCPLAVRVWNTGWCGGIWKNVKLVASKPPAD